MKNVMVIIVLLLILSGGAFLVKSQKGSNQPVTTENVVTSPSPEITPEARPSSQPETSQPEVTLDENGFLPATATVKVGTKVIWTNKGALMATVNSDPHPQHTDYPPLNLGRFNQGESLSLVFDKQGTYKYHNHLDSSQRGTVIVE